MVLSLANSVNHQSVNTDDIKVMALVLFLANLVNVTCAIRPTPPLLLINAFIRLTFYPLPLYILEGSVETGYINVTVVDTGYFTNDAFTLYGQCADTQIVRLTADKARVTFTPDIPKWFIFNVTLQAVRLGRTQIRFYVSKNLTDIARRPGHRRLQTEDGKLQVDSQTSSRTTAIDGRVDGLREPDRWYGLDPEDGLDNDPSSGWTPPDQAAASRQPDVVATSDIYVDDSMRTNQQHEAGDWPGADWWLLGNYEIVVRRPVSRVERWLDYAIMALIALNMIGIGGQIDFDEALYLVKTPAVLSIGLLCRFGIMPAIGLGLVELLKPSHIVFLAVLSMLCSPHEGVNCLLVLLSENDLTLSVTMTCVNNFATIALLPLWTIVFETRIYEVPGRAEIPFRQIFIVFTYILSSVSIGFYVERKCPKFYAKLWTYLPVFTIFTILFIIVVELYKNIFILSLVTGKIFFLSAMLAVAGYVFGSAVAFVCRQPLSRILVLAIETGCRTTYITCLLLTASLECPECDMARTTPVLGALLSVLPGFVAVLIYRIYARYTAPRYADTECTSAASKEGSQLWREATDEITELKETSM